MSTLLCLLFASSFLDKVMNWWGFTLDSMTVQLLSSDEVTTYFLSRLPSLFSPFFFRSLVSPSALYGALQWMHPDSSCTVTLFISQPQGRSATRARTHALYSQRALMPEQGNQVNWYQAVWSIVDIAGLCLFSAARPSRDTRWCKECFLSHLSVWRAFYFCYFFCNSQ